MKKDQSFDKHLGQTTSKKLYGGKCKNTQFNSLWIQHWYPNANLIYTTRVEIIGEVVRELVFCRRAWIDTGTGEFLDYVWSINAPIKGLTADYVTKKLER